MVGAFGNVGAFGFYAGMNICALIMIFFLVPGTDYLISSAPIIIFLTNLFILLFYFYYYY